MRLVLVTLALLALIYAFLLERHKPYEPIAYCPAPRGWHDDVLDLLTNYVPCKHARQTRAA